MKEKGSLELLETSRISPVGEHWKSSRSSSVGGGGQEQNAPPRATYGHFGVILELSIFKCFYLMS